MNRQLLMVCIFCSAVITAEESAKESSVQDGSRSVVKEGITIIGDQELPQVLYLIPWKSPALNRFQRTDHGHNRTASQPACTGFQR